ncbi:MAG: hypothetical protein R3F29_01285 [Planctomycetota bacterium]
MPMNLRSRRRSLLPHGLVLGALLAVATPLAAQCDTAWVPGDGVAGCDGTVNTSLLWDRDGAGPLSPVLVVGGLFTVVGGVVARNIAMRDLATGEWSALGDGSTGVVTSLAQMPDGTLMVGGGFYYLADGQVSRGLARWDGAQWLPMGFTAFTYVTCFCVLPNGSIVGAGRVENSYSPRVCRWDGAGWYQIGELWGGGIAVANAIVAMPNGDIVVGGRFASVGWDQASTVARWNGSVWSPLGAGLAGAAYATTPSVEVLSLLPNGDLVVGGNFLNAGGTAAHGVARWDGASWSSFGSGWGATVGALLQLPGGDLIAGGYRDDLPNVARWDGATWTTLGSGLQQLPLAANLTPHVRTLTRLPNGEVIAGGTFRDAGGVPVRNLATWDGASWSATVAGTNGTLLTCANLADGTLVAGGEFTSIGGVAARCVAHWDGVAWTALGGGMQRASSWLAPAAVRAVAVLPSGDLVAGGDFGFADGAPAQNLARWDGVSWSEFGGGVDGTVRSLLVLANGDLVVGGEFAHAGGVPASCIARWRNGTWSAFGPGLGQSATIYELAGVDALAQLASGELVAGGNFTRAGALTTLCIARWNGLSWSPMCSSMSGQVALLWRPGVHALLALPDGDLLVGGWFEQIDGQSLRHIARWHSGAWSAVGAGLYAVPGDSATTVCKIVALPDGDLLVGGDFKGSTEPTHVARFDGVTWSVVDGGLNAPVYGLATAPDGDFVAVGAFSRQGSPYYPPSDVAAAGLARLSTTCPSDVTSYGTGCSGAGGVDVLTATTRPWIGSSYRARATGMPPFGIAIDVHGFAPMQWPLDAILSEALPGCELLVVPDSLHLALPNAGAVELLIALPNALSLVGLVFQQQVVAVELDPSGAIAALTSSNALELTIGAF